MSIRAAVVDGICGQRNKLPLYIAVMTTMGVLLLFSALVIDPLDHPIVIIDAIVVVTSFVGFSAAYWYCGKLAMKEE